MKVPDATLVVTKEQAAVRQVDAAIAALERGHFDVAITLAGAAEGMFSHRKGDDIFTKIASSPKALERFDRKFWIQTLNLERDWLKHSSDHGMPTLSIGVGDASFAIARAMSKFDAWTPSMIEFREWFLANLEPLFKK